jgi:hypothetical protein
VSAKKKPEGKPTKKPGDGQEDDLHRKYREALERKKANDNAPEGQRTAEKGPAGSSHAAHTQRMFRRKSGG